MIKRIEAVLILYLFFISLYMILSIDSVFWNCVYYILQDVFILTLLLELFKNKVSKHLIWGAIVFTTEHSFIICSLLGKDYITYYNTLTTFNICLILCISIAVTFIVVSLFERNGNT